MAYKTVKITQEEAGEIKRDPNWDWICENHHGVCYWHKLTGELMWVPSDGDPVGYSKKIE